MDNSRILIPHTNLIRCSAVFCLWTLTLFLCQQSAKSFLRNADTYLQDQGPLLSLILTVTQSLVYILIIDTQHQRDKLFYIMAVSHMVATFATNCSMAFMSASSTFAIKLMEPITSAVVQRLVLSTSLSTSTLISLPLIVSGAVVFTGNPLATSSLSIGVLMAFASNIILAVRNIVLKERRRETMDVRLQSTMHISSVVGFMAVSTAVVYILVSKESLTNRTTMIIGMLFMSSFFHVGHSYVSTNIVLRYMTVVSHTVNNISKRLAVVLLLYTFGHRQATAWNFAGLALCTMGLLLYLRGKVDLLQKGKNHPTDSSQIMSNACKKTCLVILALLSVGVVGNVGYTNVPHDFIKYVLSVTRQGSGTMSHYNSDELLLETLKDISFGTDSFKLMNQVELYPNLHASYLSQNRTKIEEFLQWRLLDHKQNTNVLAQLLPRSTEIIRETQRVHFNIYGDLIGKFKYAMLFDVAACENKGDPTIAAAETYLLRRLGTKVIFYCNSPACTKPQLQEYVVNLSKKYSKEELVILFQGGGNLVGYVYNDVLRGTLFAKLKGFKMVIFSQSVYLPRSHQSGNHFEHCRKIYCCNPDLTIVLRDQQSLEIALKYWNNGTNLVLAPDMAFQLGSVRRFMSPSYDIMWLKRADGEAPRYSAQTLKFPKNLSVSISDWWNWKTNTGSTTMENVFLRANNGLVFLQRGRVVITDRLHGHILSTLLNIPHVLIDNRLKKLSSFHNTWTRSLNNVFLTNDSSKALGLAMTLLERYKDDLPPIAPIMEVEEYSV